MRPITWPLTLLLGLAASFVLAAQNPEPHEADRPVAPQHDDEDMAERREGSREFGGRERDEYPSTTLEPGQVPQLPGTGGGIGTPREAPEGPRPTD